MSAPQMMYSMQSVADILGVCLETMKRLVRKKELTIVRVGRNVRIPETSLMAFIERQTVKGRV